MSKSTTVVSIAMFGLTACFADGPQPVPPPPVPTQDQCPAGFGPLPGAIADGCYLQLDDAPWVAAEDRCETFESLGVRAHLIVVDREIEHRVLSDWAPRTFEGVWTAGLQRSPQDEYRNVNWVVPDVEYWGSGEPNDYGEDCDILGCSPDPGSGDERCLEYSHRTGMWNDEKCGDPAVVICEWDNVEPYNWRPYNDND